MTIKKIYNKKVITAFYDTSIYEIAKLMKKYNVGDIVIVNKEGKNIPVGIITDRDIIIKLIADEIDLKEISASDIMNSDLLLLTEQSGILEGLDMVSARGTRRAPVVDFSGELVGIVTADDFTVLIADEMESYAKLVRKQLAGNHL